MAPLGRNTFNAKNFEDQNCFKEEITQYASKVAELVCKEINILRNRERFLCEEIAPEEDPEKMIMDWIKKYNGFVPDIMKHTIKPLSLVGLDDEILVYSAKLWWILFIIIFTLEKIKLNKERLLQIEEVLKLNKEQQILIKEKN